MEDKHIPRMVSELGTPVHIPPVTDKTYSGCDLPSHLYSFSFNLNPNWSKELCDQPEILQCEQPIPRLLLLPTELTQNRYGGYRR